jgi:tetratricopeptide (TPR) repeat protein
LASLALAVSAQPDDLEAATAKFQRALKISPNDGDAQVGLAIAQGLMQQRKGNLDGAIATYKNILKRHPRSADAYNWLGVAYMQKNAMEGAIAALRRAIALKPDFVRAHNNLGSTLAQSGNLQGGIVAFRDGLKYAPEDLPLHLNLGMALRSAGDADGAIQHFEFVLNRDSGRAEVHHQLGLALRQKGDLEDAIREFDAALTINSELRETYYSLGQALRQAAAKTARTLPPQEQEALERALADARKGDLAAASRQLRNLVAANPAPAILHFHLGAALWYSGDHSAAAAELEQAVRLDPSAAEAASFRGLAFREAGDLPQARVMCHRTIALNPKSQTAYFDHAIVLLRLSNLDQALGQLEAGLNVPNSSSANDVNTGVVELRRAISSNPNRPDVHNIMGRLLGLAGADSEQVIAEFQAAIRLRPNFAEASNNLGLVYTQIGDDAKAIAAFRQAIAMQQNYADAHANLGAVLTATDPEKAIIELEKAVALQPGLLKARYNLAIAYGASPKHGMESGIEELRKLIAMDAAYPRAQLALGRALLRTDAVPEGVGHLERAVQLDPQSGESHYQLGLGLARLGRRQESASELQKGRELIAMNQRNQTLVLDMAEGRSALEKGDLEHAKGTFRRVIKQMPDFAEAHYQLGLTSAREGDRQGATAAFTRALELDPELRPAREELDRFAGTRVVREGDDPDQMKRLESYIREGKFQQAEFLAAAYVGERPTSSWGWYTLGYSLFGQQKLAEAIKALAKSLQLNVRNADAHKVLGRCLMMIGRFDTAQTEFEQAARYGSESPEPHYNLGKLFSIQDQWSPAVKAFEEALRRDPFYMEAHDGLGFALDALNQDEAAVASFQIAIRINDERKAAFASPYVNLSAHYNRAGDQAAAVEWAQKAITINSGSDRAWFQLGKAQVSKGELSAAADSLNRAISINGRSSSYFYVLATTYRRLGKLDESRQAMESFGRLENESKLLEQKRREARGQGAVLGHPELQPR